MGGSSETTGLNKHVADGVTKTPKNKKATNKEREQDAHRKLLSLLSSGSLTHCVSLMHTHTDAQRQRRTHTHSVAVITHTGLKPCAKHSADTHCLPVCLRPLAPS